MSDYYRIKDGAIIAGVCAGVADSSGRNVSTVRLLYLLTASFGLSMLFVYTFQWLVYPVKGVSLSDAPKAAKAHNESFAVSEL